MSQQLHFRPCSSHMYSLHRRSLEQCTCAQGFRPHSCSVPFPLSPSREKERERERQTDRQREGGQREIYRDGESERRGGGGAEKDIQRQRQRDRDGESERRGGQRKTHRDGERERERERQREREREGGQREIYRDGESERGGGGGGREGHTETEREGGRERGHALPRAGVAEIPGELPGLPMPVRRGPALPRPGVAALPGELPGLPLPGGGLGAGLICPLSRQLFPIQGIRGTGDLSCAPPLACHEGDIAILALRRA